ncbi:phosphonate ABC transporter ATP-binding protein [Pinisolibacter sp.]|uniref:phosphonate ABC transporter ATP-binding protein n=1 Tax=Pinisolibacter sp. TaxID=2172024 RepID=UPI002FDEAD50
MLTIERLTRRFGDFVAVDAVDLEIPAGQMVGVIGRSGAGKSTLLRMIDRLIEPSEGRIVFEGREITALKGAGLRHWRRDCAMVFQQFALVDRLDVLTNVLMGRLDHSPDWRALLKLWTADDKAIALSALELFDIATLAANRAGSLSGGQQQRVAIARALVQEPRVLLADEPIASLDPRNTRVVMDSLLRVNRDFGITVLTNLHSIDLAKRYCDRLIGMKAGRVVFDGTPRDLTDTVVRDLYGLEAGDVIELPKAGDPTPDEIRASWDAAHARERV